MKRLEAWLLHLSTIVLTLTGLGYAIMHYLMKPSDPFSVVNHPLEPHMRNIHILMAPVLVVAIGIILHSHIFFKIENGARSARKSGLTLIPLFVIMIASGYLLQIITGKAHGVVVWIHLGSGILWAVAYGTHHLASLKLRKSMLGRSEAAINNGNPAGKNSATTSIVRNPLPRASHLPSRSKQ